MGRRGNGNGTSELVVLLPPDVCDRNATMETRSRRTRLRSVVGICVVLALTGIVYLGYFCPDHVCALTNRDIKDSARVSEGLAIGTGSSALTSGSPEIEKNSLLPVARPSFRPQTLQGSLGYDDIFSNDTFQFDINAHDVMVFLHIQKTGTFSVVRGGSVQSCGSPGLI